MKNIIIPIVNIILYLIFGTYQVMYYTGYFVWHFDKMKKTLKFPIIGTLNKYKKLGIESDSNGRIEVNKEVFYKREDVQREIEAVRKSRDRNLAWKIAESNREMNGIKETDGQFFPLNNELAYLGCDPYTYVGKQGSKAGIHGKTVRTWQK